MNNITKTKEKNRIRNKGITLIALVITIIVLLILAGVSIATLTGENGILTRAVDAKKETEIASVKEQAQLDLANGIAEQLENGENVELNDAIVKSILEAENIDNPDKYYKSLESDRIITISGYEILYSELYTTSDDNKDDDDDDNVETGNDNIKEYTSDGVPIPKGFYYVGGTKESGVIISDDPIDEKRGVDYETTKTLQGNQFVWVPVETDEDFRRYSGYYNGKLQELTADYCEPSQDGYKYDTEDSEYNTMKESVLTNNGFYVARYEASQDKEDSSKVASIYGQDVWINIKWGDSMTEIGTEGAVAKSQEMYSDTNIYGVTSTLIYGVQWDAIMSWIDENYKNEDGTLYAARSFVAYPTNKGNFSSSGIIKTGSNSNFQEKNIFDLAGNISEWTMEAYQTNCRVTRGGTYQHGAGYYPTSSRLNYAKAHEGQSYIGFRVTLYINA